MGVFNKEEGEATINDKEAETIIGPSVKVEGSFEGEKNVLVEGQIMGNLKTSGNLTVAEGAKIKADVEANNLLVSGEMIGNIKCHNKIELTASAKINGDIETDIISVETGAVIKGNCLTGSTEAAKDEVKVKKTEIEDKTKKK